MLKQGNDFPKLFTQTVTKFSSNNAQYKVCKHKCPHTFGIFLVLLFRVFRAVLDIWSHHMIFIS